MTNFYAIYLFVVVDIVFLAIGFYFKRGWPILLSSIGWLFTMGYCVATGISTGNMYVTAFGGFSLIASITTIIASMAVGKVKPVPPAEVSHSDHIFNEVERVRKLRNRHKPQTKGYFEP